MVRALPCVALMLVAASAAAKGPPPPKARWEQLPGPAAMPDASGQGDVDSGGAKIHYTTYGLPDGEPVILLHGGLGNSEHWGNQMPALADKFRVIAIDSRGQGRSTRTKATITYDLMASDVVAVMDKLEIKRAAIVGWSDGGEVALLLGIHYPDRVDKLFALGVNYDEKGSKPRGSRTATFAQYAVRCRADYLRMTKPQNPERAWDTLVDGMLPLWREPMSLTRDQLTTIKAPTLIADGDHDEVIVLDQEREMAKLIPDAKLVVWPDASHFAMWQDPDDVNAALVEFLAPHKSS
jgi:pimeloyl-ACP methyl ester carboxylesterase